MHARSGGDIEVMGLMLGKFTEHTFHVMDVFALPVEGCETRVNAQEVLACMGPAAAAAARADACCRTQAAYNYMFAYQELVKKVGRLEDVLGW